MNEIFIILVIILVIVLCLLLVTSIGNNRNNIGNNRNNIGNNRNNIGNNRNNIGNIFGNNRNSIGNIFGGFDKNKYGGFDLTIINNFIDSVKDKIHPSMTGLPHPSMTSLAANLDKLNKEISTIDILEVSRISSAMDNLKQKMKTINFQGESNIEYRGIINEFINSIQRQISSNQPATTSQSLLQMQSDKAVGLEVVAKSNQVLERLSALETQIQENKKKIVSLKEMNESQDRANIGLTAQILMLKSENLEFEDQIKKLSELNHKQQLEIASQEQLFVYEKQDIITKHERALEELQRKLVDQDNSFKEEIAKVTQELEAVNAYNDKISKKLQKLKDTQLELYTANQKIIAVEGERDAALKNKDSTQNKLKEKHRLFIESLNSDHAEVMKTLKRKYTAEIGELQIKYTEELNNFKTQISSLQESNDILEHTIKDQQSTIEDQVRYEQGTEQNYPFTTPQSTSLAIALAPSNNKVMIIKPSDYNTSRMPNIPKGVSTFVPLSDKVYRQMLSKNGAAAAAAGGGKSSEPVYVTINPNNIAGLFLINGQTMRVGI